MPRHPDIEQKRIQSEAEFFDEAHTQSNGKCFSVYSKALLDLLEAIAEGYLPDLKKKRLLFYGCGVSWERASRFYQMGASVRAVDISASSIEMMRNKAMREGVGPDLRFDEMNCESLKFPDAYFDVVYGRAILHHLDFAAANKEIRRVLQKRGVAIFLEPLGMNPFVNLYRRLTPGLRTPDEKPLTYEDLSVLCQGFSDVTCRELTFSALPVIALSSVSSQPNISKNALERFYRFDERLFGMVPWFRRLCWNVLLVLRK